MLLRQQVKLLIRLVWIATFIVGICISIFPIFASEMTNTPNHTVLSVDSFTTEELNYYAYMDLATADESLKPIILETRNRIIWSKSWVADGITGRILNIDGSIIEELPQFSELFPEDWDEPILPVQEVDESSN